MAKPARASLGNLSSAIQPAAATSATVETVAPRGESKAPPKLTIYLTPEEVRTLKLIGVDSGQRLTDIGALAIREWLERNGHARKHNA